MDYCFLGEKCEVKDVDDGKPENATVLVAYDELKEAFWAVNAPRKGAVHGGVKSCVDMLEDSGYGGNGITVKSDQEQSICALRRSIAVMRKVDTTHICSPVRCSKSNGRMENAVKIFSDQLRTLKHLFASEVKRQLKVEHAMYSWLIAWTSEVMNKYNVRANGTTSQEMITKRECRHQVFGFWEHVLW